MKTTFNYISDTWKLVKNHCRTTVGKQFTESEPTKEFKKKILISEHSPIRLIEIDWSWKGIKSWIATHWSRHKFEKFITTQRDDRVSNDISRNELPQSAPVNFDGYANAQQLIDAFRKRLCYQAHKETREYAVDFKMELQNHESELSKVLVPNCVYRMGCPEFNECGHMRRFIEYVESVDKKDSLFDISKRYDLYCEFLKEVK